MERSFRFRPVIARRFPDPNFRKEHGAERHLFIVPVKALPDDLPLDPNARRPNVRKRVYQDVKKSLLGLDGSESGTFHLKNKGITIVAESVRQSTRDEAEYVIKLRTGVHGILDGGHTYRLIMDHKANLPDDQYVQVDVRVGIPDAWVPEIAGGLNTSVQVEDMSLDNLAGEFDWLKKLLQKQPYFPQIAWSENDAGEYDARDIISMMLTFNIGLYPNDADEHPVAAYEKKSLALKAFEEKPKTFRALKPIVTEILQLYDVIGKDARHRWNEETGGKGGALAFVEGRTSGTWKFIFTGKTDAYQLYSGALYPMLAAFRWYVRKKPDGTYGWRTDFNEVLKAWEEIGAELVKATLLQSNELGRNPNAVGKSRNHWANLHMRVAKFDLLARQNNNGVKK